VILAEAPGAHRVCLGEQLAGALEIALPPNDGGEAHLAEQGIGMILAQSTGAAFHQRLEQRKRAIDVTQCVDNLP